MKMDENCLKANNLKIHPDFKKDFSNLMDNEKVGKCARFINLLDSLRKTYPPINSVT